MKVLLMDSQQLLYKSLYQHGKFLQDLHKAIVFGTLQQIKTIVATIQPDCMVHCWDGPNNERKKLLPTYKASRAAQAENPDIEKLFQARNTLMSIFTMVGWCQFLEEGLEADDLIANCVLEYKDHEKIIASTDNDLYQLLSSSVSIFNTSTKKMYTKDHFRHEYGLEPHQWRSVKAIAGCIGDNVKGVRGIGEKRAISYLQHNDKYAPVINSNMNLIDLNLQLVSIPFRRVSCPNLKPLDLNMDTFLDICLIYDFRSFIDNMKRWKEIFNVRREYQSNDSI